MKKQIEGLDRVLAFVERHRDMAITSTGATVVNFSGGLYNVKGSTPDPKRVPGHENEAWKQLLISYGIDANCYVTNPNAGGSHPDFSVGGHMTMNSDGSVGKDKLCYLMPLCSWHNSTSKDGMLFAHTNTKMLQLSGYMLGELAATFMLRTPSAAPYAVLYHTEHGWAFRDLAEEQASNLKSDFLHGLAGAQDGDYVLFERSRDNVPLHYIREVNLPSAAP